VNGYMEKSLMMTPESSLPNNSYPINRLVSRPSLDQPVVSRTKISHLPSEDHRRQAPHQHKELEAVRKVMDKRETDAVPYRIFHEDARKKIASGMSHHEIRAVMVILVDMDDTHLASIIRQAYEDALAGVLPKE
jgi:hypothetical protein